MVNEELNFFKMGESAALVFRNGAEEFEDFRGGFFADATAFAGVGVAESDFVALAELGEGFDCLGMLALFLQISNVVEGVDYGSVEGRLSCC